MRSADLELDLDVFAGPFDLLLAVVLREEISLLEVELGEVVVAYVGRLEETGELDLEAATEFLVLIASLLELKSRLMLPAEDEIELDLGPEEAAEELLARMLEYRRYKTAGADLAARLERERPYLYRSAPLPQRLRRVSVEAARAVYDPDSLGAALGGLLRTPPTLDTSHSRPTVSLERRLDVLRRPYWAGSILTRETRRHGASNRGSRSGYFARPRSSGCGCVRGRSVSRWRR
jgi:segregation and condensation protein A